MTDETVLHQDSEDVKVTYNGDEKTFEYRRDELVETLLDDAKKRFHVEGQHRLSLFTESGIELPDKETLHDAGVHAGELLVLRQSTVRGGSCA